MVKKKHIQRRILVVSGLPKLTTEAMIREHFSKFCNLHSVQLIINPETKEPRGFAYITLEDSSEANHVLRSEHRILDKILQVEIPSKKGYRRVMHSHVTQKRLYVYDLPKLTTYEDLLQTFQLFGKIVATALVFHPATKAPLHCGYVDFATSEMGEKALQQTIFIRGIPIEVSITRKAEFSGGVSRCEPKLSTDSQKVKKSIIMLNESRLLINTAALEEEVSNYQCLGLNPCVSFRFGAVPLRKAFEYGWFGHENLPTQNSPLRRKAKSENHDTATSDNLKHYPKGRARSEPKPQDSLHTDLKLPSELTTALDERVSNYSFKIEKPQQFLRRIKLKNMSPGKHQPKVIGSFLTENAAENRGF